MTRVGSDGLFWYQFTETAGYQQALARVPPPQRRDFAHKLETAFQRFAFLDGAASVTVDDLRRAAGLAGADAFLAAGDLSALGIAPEAHDALLGALDEALGKDARRAGVQIARNGSESAPGQLNEGLGAPVMLGERAAVASAMAATSREDVAAFCERFGVASTASFERARKSALADVVRQRGTFPGFETNDPEHVQRLLGLGYTLASARISKPAVSAPAVTQHLRGGNDFFALGDYALSDTAKAQLARVTSASRVVIEASTDKVSVTPQLRARLDAYLGASTLTDAQDPSGNQRLARARCETVRAYLAARGINASAFADPVLSADRTTTGADDDPASRFIDVSFDVTTPGEGQPAELTYALIRPPRAPPLPRLSDHVAFAIDVSPSVDHMERISALQQQLEALERGGFTQVSYELITFTNKGSPSRTTLHGSPAEVIAQTAAKLGIRSDVDAIRAFVNNRGPTPGDDSPDEPLAAVTELLSAWRAETQAAGFTPTVIVATDVDPKRTKALRSQGFLVANPSESDRIAR